jgi:DNA-binding transcriptional ArsR family regulator
MKKKYKQMNDELIELVAARFRALAEPMRLKILNSLGAEELSVNELVEATGSGQANISKHLGILFKEGLVARRKEGLNTFYRVADKSIFVLCEAVCANVGEYLAAKHGAVRNFIKQ